MVTTCRNQCQLVGVLLHQGDPKSLKKRKTKWRLDRYVAKNVISLESRLVEDLLVLGMQAISSVSLLLLAY